MRSNLEDMLAQAVRPSGYEDALAGIGASVVAFEIGRLLELPDRLGDLAVGDGRPLVGSALMLAAAIILGGLVSALHRARRMSRERAARRKPTHLASPQVVGEAVLPHVGNDAAISIVPAVPWRDLRIGHIPKITSEC